MSEFVSSTTTTGQRAAPVTELPWATTSTWATTAPTGLGGSTVAAEYVGASVSRSLTNRRRLRIRLDLDQASMVAVRVTRPDEALGFERVALAGPGRRTFTVPLSRGAAAGSARVSVHVTGTGGAVRVIRQTIQVPARILS